MLIRLIVLIAAFASLLDLGVLESKRPIIGTLKGHLDDSGCEFTRIELPDTALPVFYSSFQEAWMDIDGQEVTFREVSSQNNHPIFNYKASNITVILDLGKEHIPDDSYSNATITVIKKGLKTTIRVKGWCEC